MDNESLFYDPYTDQFFYTTMEEIHKRMNELNDIYSGELFPVLTEDRKPCLKLLLNDNY